MGGVITSKSELQKGTTFILDLPLPLVETSQIEKPMEVAGPLRSNLNKIHILLVEDNPVNRLVATKLLEKLNAEVEIAENGIIAIEKWERGNFDLIFMDCQIPEMDGYTAHCACYGRGPLSLYRCGDG